MCGIFVSPFLEGTRRMLDAMRYRGPDDLQIQVAGGLAVGFVRLAIVDVDNVKAEQPRTSPKGRIVCFNGELYNYKQLYPHTASEVELLGHMLDHRVDPRAVLDGDYAIFSYEPSQHRVTLYRDRFGVCPLYYQTAPFFAVSSERRRLAKPKAVRPHERVIIQLDSEGMRAVSVKRDQWQHYGVTFDSITSDGLVSGLFDAVRSRALHTATDFSATCSGGIDSSAVLFALAHQGLAPKQLLCVSFGEDTEDLRLARMVADCLKLPLLPIVVDQEMVEEYRPQILEHMDMEGKRIQPLHWRIALRNWFVAQQSTSRVVLTGEGSDELNDGYPPHNRREHALYLKVAKQISQVRSLPSLSLELSNKIGLAHSVEFRAPFLHSRFSYIMLASDTGQNKAMLREALRRLGAPPELCYRDKWGSNEQLLDGSL